MFLNHELPSSVRSLKNAVRSTHSGSQNTVSPAVTPFIPPPPTGTRFGPFLLGFPVSHDFGDCRRCNAFVVFPCRADVPFRVLIDRCRSGTNPSDHPILHSLKNGPPHLQLTANRTRLSQRIVVCPSIDGEFPWNNNSLSAFAGLTRLLRFLSRYASHFAALAAFLCRSERCPRFECTCKKPLI